MTSLSIIVPCYNSADSLDGLVERIAAATEGREREVLLVNDGSRDQTWKSIERLSSRYPWVRGIELMRNYGQHNALLAGIREARFELVVTLDDDGQNPPEEIPQLIEVLQSGGHDVVYGVPQRQQHGLLRDLASTMTKLALQTAMGAEVARNISAYRVFRTQLRDAFMEYRSPFVSIDVLLTWATARFGLLQVRHEARAVGTSNYTLSKLVTHAFNMMTGFSTLPLQVSSWLGFAAFVFGLCILSYVLVRYALYGGVVPGFTFLSSAIAVFSGAQLLSLGIIGEYLARMHFRTLEKPQYVIRGRSK